MKKQTKTSKKKNKGGRIPKEIDWEAVDELLKIQCTGEEIAVVLKISYDTLERRVKQVHNMSYAEYSAIKRAAGYASLRRAQFKMAQTIPSMAIWLGKQYLGQSDKIDHLTNNEPITDIKVTIVEKSVKNLNK